MIHTIEIGPETDPQELLKQFRKKLMTGGAVLRLRCGLSADEQDNVFAKFSDHATQYNAFGEVLVQLAAEHSLSPELRIKLEKLNLPNITRALRLLEQKDTPRQ